MVGEAQAKDGATRPLASTVVTTSQGPKSGMTMDTLRKCYEDIQQAGAIFYPVAYQFLRELGQGRQGVVFLGMRQGARGCITEHAIKVFDPQLYRSPEEYWTDMGRIASQISKLHRVKSPHLVSRQSYEETYGIGYVEMDSIDGIDMRQFMMPGLLKQARSQCSKKEWEALTEPIFRETGKRVRLRQRVVVFLMRSLLRGLEQLHDMNFLHCDVKPANIMIDRVGSVQLVDFGRAVRTGERLNFLLGSPLYMAPEIHRREPSGPQSDLYSVGLVALEMLSGQQICKDPRADEAKLLKLKMALPRRLEKLLPKYVLMNTEIPTILRRLIEPDPAKRFANAKDVELGHGGLKAVNSSFARDGVQTELARELSDYIAKLVDARTDRVEVDEELAIESSQIHHHARRTR